VSELTKFYSKEELVEYLGRYVLVSINEFEISTRVVKFKIL